MLPACLRLADDVFPRVRAGAARRLVAAGWSQTRTADALGLSQAMVSRHASQRAAEDPLVARLADDLARELQHGPATGEARPERATRDAPGGVPPGAALWCGTLAVTQTRAGAADALADLLEAERALRAGLGAALVPQIGLNVVRALPGAAGPGEVLGYPARIVAASGRLLAPAPPELGGSGHLAACLLLLRERRPDAHALASARGGRDVVAAARRLGWTVAALPATGPAEGEARFAAAAARQPGADAFHDPGPPGIEPCLYVPGATAQAAAASLLRLGTVMP